MTSIDPPDAAAPATPGAPSFPATTGPGPIPGQANVPTPGWSTATGGPVAPPAAKKSKAPLFVGLAVIVAALVAGGFFLLGGDDDDGQSGAGDFTYDVGTKSFTVHRVELETGDAFAVRATKLGSAKVAIGIDKATAERLLKVDGLYSDSDGIGQLYSESNQSVASDLLSDLTDEQADLIGQLTDASDDFVALPGYDGLVLGTVDADELTGSFGGSGKPTAVSATLVAPTDLTLSVLLIAEKPSSGVKLQVRTKTNPDAPNSYDSESYQSVFSDAFYSDFGTDLTDEFRLPASDTSDGDGSSADDIDTSDATDSECRTEQRTLETAIQAYYAQNNEYPDSFADLVGDFLKDYPRNHDYDSDTHEVTPTGDCS